MLEGLLVQKKTQNRNCIIICLFTSEVISGKRKRRQTNSDGYPPWVSNTPIDKRVICEGWKPPPSEVDFMALPPVKLHVVGVEFQKAPSPIDASIITNM